MADRLFEQGSSVPPQSTFRLASGKAGSATLNHAWSDVLTWIKENLISPEDLIEIGAWDMDATASVDVAYTAPSGFEVIGCIVSIIKDTSGEVYQLSAGGYAFYSSGIEFTLTRTGSGIFDSTDFDGAGNRGYIIVKLQAV